MIHIYNPNAFFLLLLVLAVAWFGFRTYDKMGRVRKAVVIALRVLLVLLLVGVLLNVYVWWTDRGRQLCVYYLVDLSTSMQPHRKAMSEAVTASLKQKPRGDWAGLIVFDEHAAVAVPANPDPNPAKFSEAIEGTGAAPLLPPPVSAEQQETDISGALRLAMSSFPSEMAGRIVLISDFNETTGSALAEAASAHGAGVDILSLRPAITLKPDLAVEQVAISDDVKLNRAFTVNVSVVSSFSAMEPGATAEVRLYRNQVRVASQKFEPKMGVIPVSFRQRLDRGGRFLYEARLVTTLPHTPENDRAYAYLELKGLPRVLVVADDGPEQRFFRRALEDGRLNVEVRTSLGLPQTMLDLQDFRAVFIGDVPASAMTSNQMKLLHDYAHEFGGSVILTGGEHALSAGGYAGTPVEEMMPVECAFKENETPTSALVFIADSSRSIELHNEDFTAGKKTAFMTSLFRNAIDTLGDRDQMGVVGLSGSLKNPTWFMGLQKVVDRSRLKLFQISFQDYSHLLQSFDAAQEHLTKVNATNKGIILVTDGYVEPGPDYALLAMQLAADDLSVSCVAVGTRANKGLLRDIARWGNGRYYEAESEADAKKVFEREIEEFARGVVVEKPVEVMALMESDVFQGVDAGTSPTLFGYVRVKPKLAADVLMVTRRSRDPMLVSWAFGSGRATVLSTDVGGKWSQLWTDEWADQFGLLLRNLVDWSAPKTSGVDYLPRVTVRGWELSFDVDALDAMNRFSNDKPPSAGFYALGEKGQVFSEAGRVEVPLELAGPGLYRGRHKVDQRGVYLFKVCGEDRSGVRTTGAVVATNRKLASLLPNRALEDKLCEVTGGRVAADPGDVFRISESAKKRPRDLSGLFLSLACGVFALDILARRWPAIAQFLRRREQP